MLSVKLLKPPLNATIQYNMSLDTPQLDSSLLESLGGTEEVDTTPAPDTKPLGNRNHTGTTSGTEERALVLLGSGVQAEAVAAALGVTPSRISQLLSREDFAQRVAELRYQALQEHNVRDNEYDSIEDELLAKLRKSLPLMIRPDTILRAIAVINGATRRGQSAPDQITNTQNIVNLILPTVVAERFATNIDNQVIKAGDQELLTMDSGTLLEKLQATQKKRADEYEHTSEEET